MRSSVSAIVKSAVDQLRTGPARVGRALLSLSRRSSRQASSQATGNRARGSVTTATAVMLLVTLATGAGIALSSADRAMFASIEYKNHTEALMLAESAVEDAMGHLDDISDWTTVTLPYENFTPRHRVGNGVVWADIRNDIYDPGGTRDTNGMVLVKGYGQRLNTTYIESIEVLYFRPTFDLPPVAGVVMCGTDILEGGNGGVDGYNHLLPEVGCTGSHCNAVRSYTQPDVAGIAFENAGRETQVQLPSTVVGNPPIASGVCWLQGRGGLCARARALMRQVPRLVGLETITAWPKGDYESYGSTSDPKFVRVPKGTELRLNGNSQGAGVLFVEGTLTCRGTFTWTGAIFVGPGAVLDLNGTYNIFGSVITAGNSTRPATLMMNGNSTISWAADAIAIGPFNVPAMMNSWREFK